MKKYIIKYIDQEGMREHHTIRADNQKQAWHKARLYCGDGSVINELYEQIYDGHLNVIDVLNIP